LEVAVLDRARPQRRKFKRVQAAQVARLLEETSAPESEESEEGEGKPEGGDEK
jgi:proteasome alpha subunit